MMPALYKGLMVAGVLPFVACALALALGTNQLPLLGSSQTLLSLYSLVIASFMAGSHWGLHLQALSPRWQVLLALFSNLLAIALCLGFLLLNFHGQILLSVAVFTLILGVDERLCGAGIISAHYFRLRLIITALVVASLLLAFSVSA